MLYIERVDGSLRYGDTIIALGIDEPALGLGRFANCVDDALPFNVKIGLDAKSGWWIHQIETLVDEVINVLPPFSEWTIYVDRDRNLCFGFSEEKPALYFKLKYEGQ